MKKHIYLIVIGFLFISKVNAFSNELTVSFDGYLCTRDNIFPVYNIYDNENNYYFLKPNEFYNFDMRDYEEKSFSETIYSPKIRMFTSYNYKFNNSSQMNLYINKMLWEQTTSDEYYLCDINKNIINYDSSFDEIYAYIKGLTQEIGLPNFINVVSGKEFSLNYPNIDSYNIFNIDAFDYYRPNSNTIIMKGEKGSYELTFSLNSDDMQGKLYHDKNNYLLQNGGFFDTSKTITINVDDPTLQINNYSSHINDFSSICFNIQSNNYTTDFCANSEGIAEIKLPYGIYYLKSLSEMDNDFSNSYIVLDDFIEEININWEEGISKIPECDVEIIPDDTLELKGLIILSIILIGLYFGIKKMFAK